MRTIYLSLLAIFAAGAALAQGVTGGQISDTNWIVVGSVGVVMMAAGWGLRAAQSQTERWAAPRRGKPLNDQTLADKAIIELDKKVDLINIDILERFIRSFVMARLPLILARVPALGPIVVAGEFAQEAMKEWKSRNPETQRDMVVTLEAMKGKLAGAVGEQVKDVLTAQAKDALTEALRKAGAKEWADAATKAATQAGTSIGNSAGQA